MAAEEERAHLLTREAPESQEYASTMAIQAELNGTVARGFERVRDAFAANFAQHGDVGAACCVYLHGKPVVDLWGGARTPGGQPYTAETLQMVASTTKGMVAIAAHLLAQDGKLDFDAPVTRYWPEFAHAGKDEMPVRWLFSHRAGLAAIDRPVTLQDVYARDPVVDALAAQEPLWEPNTAHGYHVGTFGWLAGEVIKRAAGKSVDALSWETPEAITIKPLYTSDDLADLDFLHTFPGLPPFLRGPSVRANNGEGAC